MCTRCKLKGTHIQNTSYFINPFKNKSVHICLLFLAALAALYLTLVTDSVSECHFRISTQGVTFEAWDPSDLWSEWCLDKMTKIQKDKKTKRQKDKKTKRQIPNRELNIATSGQFRTLAMFIELSLITYEYGMNVW